MDPRYKTTVRAADQTVHGRLATSRLATLLATVQQVGHDEIARVRREVIVGGSEDGGGRMVSLHTLLYRLGYNVNCRAIFGPRLDHVATRVALQSFTEVGVCVYDALVSEVWPTLTIDAYTAYIEPTLAIQLVPLASPAVVDQPGRPRGAKVGQGAQGTLPHPVRVSEIWEMDMYRLSGQKKKDSDMGRDD